MMTVVGQISLASHYLIKACFKVTWLVVIIVVVVVVVVAAAAAAGCCWLLLAAAGCCRLVSVCVCVCVCVCVGVCVCVCVCITLKNSFSEDNEMLMIFVPQLPSYLSCVCINMLCVRRHVSAEQCMSYACLQGSAITRREHTTPRMLVNLCDTFVVRHHCSGK